MTEKNETAPAAKPIHISGTEFDAKVVQSKKPVLLDVWASWCGPCIQVAPILEEIAVERTDITVAKLQIDDEDPATAQVNGAKASELGVMSIPTLFLFKDGKQLDKKVGGATKEEFITWIDGALSPAK